MEDRTELAKILLDGLPDQERDHVVRVIRATDRAKLDRLRAAGAEAVDGDVDDQDDVHDDQRAG